VTENFVAAEGMFSGQFVYCGTKAALKIGNVLPLGKMPEGLKKLLYNNFPTFLKMHFF